MTVNTVAMPSRPLATLDKLDCVVQTPSSSIRAQALYLKLDIQGGSTPREEILKSYPKTWVQQMYLARRSMGPSRVSTEFIGHWHDTKLIWGAEL